MKPDFLKGVRFTDLTWAGAGPFCTKLFSDFGAEVIKIETSTRPDPVRLGGPFLDGIAGINRSGYFASRNSGKKSVSINLKSEERLRQGDIAEELAVSPTPVREALKILEAEGYIISLSHRGVLVPPFNVEQAKEIFDLRMLLERRLTEKAFDRISPDRLIQLEAMQAEYDSATCSMNRNQLRSANYRFHFMLYDWANEPQTLAFVRVLWAKYPFHYLDAIESRTRRAVMEHEAFLVEVRRGNLRRALEAMEAHIEGGFKEFSQQQVMNVMS